MADNTELPSGSGGDTIATDEIGGVKHQRVKVQYGADGFATDVDASNPLPIEGAVTVTGEVDVTGVATQAGQLTSQVTLEAIQAAAEAIQTAVEVLDNVVAGSEAQVDIVGPVPAGTNNIGDVDVLTLPSIPAGTNNIGDVDVASSVLPSGASTSAKQDTVIGHVDGIETSLADAVTALQILDNIVSGSEAQVDVVAALPAGNNNIGDVDVASIAAGTNSIGNVGIVPRTTGGATIFTSVDLDETEEEIKGSAGQVFGWFISNDHASDEVYVKFYNATAASVSVGSTAPVMTLRIPPNAAANVKDGLGLVFGTAITVAATTGPGTSDTGAPAANQVIANIFYA